MAKRILIVDDDPDVVVFLSTLLQDNGYTTLDASNGNDALEKMKSREVDLILLDLMMPKKSGIALLSEMKADETLRQIPVIMVTGVSGETGIDLDSFLERGEKEGQFLAPAGYVEKPVEPKKLLDLIEASLPA